MDRHAQDLFRLARGLSPSAVDAEDAVQDTLMAAFRWIGTFDGRASLQTWMSRILIRRVRKLGMARSRHSAVEFDEQTNLMAEQVSPATTAADQDVRLDLAAVLPRLAADYREVIVLRELQGLSYAEIASLLQIPQGTVESRIHRARLELRRLLCAYRP